MGGVECMRKHIINGILGAIFGFFMVKYGFSWTTPEFLFGSLWMFVLIGNNSFD